MTRLLCFSLLIFLIAPGSTIAENKAVVDPFWVLSQQDLGSPGSKVYLPTDKKFANQGFLVYSTLPPTTPPPVLREVLAELYTQVDDLKILGQKQVPWHDGVGDLVSFSGVHEKKKVLGRAVVANSEQGTEILMLVRHPQADPLLLDNFERIRSAWPRDLGAATTPD